MSKKIIGILFAVLIICSCNNGKPGSSIGNKITTSKAGEGEAGELITCDALDFESLDVLSGNGTTGFLFHATNVYETLVLYENGEFVPWLAESWEVNGREYIFHLRKGIKFSDGNDFNASVVKLNFDMVKEHGGARTDWFTGITQLESIQVVDEYTVKMIYLEPYYAAIQDFTAVFPTGIMSPAMFENGNIPYYNTEVPVGTGPYKIKEAKRGKYYTFERNEEYWAEKPEARTYTVKIIPDIDARVLALRSGEVDFILGINNLSYDAISQFINDDNFTVKLSDRTDRTTNILLNTASPVLRDKKVRLALEYGINKDEIVNTILYKMEEKADYLLNPGLPYCDIDVTPYPYDKGKAAQLLDEAGWHVKPGKAVREKDGVSLELDMIYINGKKSEEEIVQAFKAYMSDIGINLKTAGYEEMMWYTKGSRGEFDLTIHSTYGFPYDPHLFIGPMANYAIDYIAQQGLEMKKEIDEHIAQLNKTVDEKEIRENIDFIFGTLHREAVNIPVSYSKQVVIFNNTKIKDAGFFGQMEIVDLHQFHFVSG